MCTHVYIYIDIYIYIHVYIYIYVYALMSVAILAQEYTRQEFVSLAFVATRLQMSDVAPGGLAESVDKVSIEELTSFFEDLSEDNFAKLQAARAIAMFKRRKKVPAAAKRADLEAVPGGVAESVDISSEEELVSDFVDFTEANFVKLQAAITIAMENRSKKKQSRGPVGSAARRGAPWRGAAPPRGPVGGGPPAEGPRGGAARRGAEGDGGEGGDRLGSGHPKRLYKAPTDYTKPQQTIQNPNRIYKAPQSLHKTIKHYTKLSK